MRYEACKAEKCVNTVECPTLSHKSRHLKERAKWVLIGNICNKIDGLTQTLYCIIPYSKKPSQCRDKRSSRASASLSLPPLSLSSSFTTCVQSLQIIWIQKIVGCFAEPDQGLTVIPRVNLVRACAILRPMRTIRWAS